MDTTKLQEAFEEWVQASEDDKHLAFKKVYREFLRLGIEAFSQPPDEKLYNEYGICGFMERICQKITTNFPRYYYPKISSEISNKLFRDISPVTYLFGNHSPQKKIYRLKWEECYFERADFLKQKLAELENS
jgi:hypothetical protein